jgi:hypothetical protein
MKTRSVAEQQRVCQIHFSDHLLTPIQRFVLLG